MAMKKADMEAHHSQYGDLMSEVRLAQEIGNFLKALDAAKSAWPYIDGMMQYERRFNQKEFTTIEAIDVVLEYAPLLFDIQSLCELEKLLKGSRRIEKNTTEVLKERLVEARSMTWEAYHLWEQLESRGEVRLDVLQDSLEREANRWHHVAFAWEQMGIIERQPEVNSDRFALRTRMDALTLAKCPKCGVVVRAAKAKFLREQSCPKCKTKHLFVILVKKPADSDVEG